jgi:hypothetical protein
MINLGQFTHFTVLRTGEIGKRYSPKKSLLAMYKLTAYNFKGSFKKGKQFFHNVLNINGHTT